MTNRREASFTWTDAAIARVKQGYADGLTYTEIGLELHLTRNAVAGKVGRLGLATSTPRPEHPLGDARVKHSRKPARKPPVKPPPEIPPPTQAVELPPDESPMACTFGELTYESCRWPLPDDRYCGATRLNRSSPYCGRHVALAYRPAPRLRAPMVWRGVA